MEDKDMQITYDTGRPQKHESQTDFSKQNKKTFFSKHSLIPVTWKIEDINMSDKWPSTWPIFIS